MHNKSWKDYREKVINEIASNLSFKKAMKYILLNRQEEKALNLPTLSM